MLYRLSYAPTFTYVLIKKGLRSSVLVAPKADAGNCPQLSCANVLGPGTFGSSLEEYVSWVDAVAVGFRTGRSTGTNPKTADAAGGRPASPPPAEPNSTTDKFNGRITLGLINPTAPVMGPRDAVDKFLGALEAADAALATRRMYRTSLGRLYRTTGDSAVNDISPAHIDADLAQSRRTRKTSKGRTITPSQATLARYHREVRRFQLRWDDGGMRLGSVARCMGIVPVIRA